ncbi:hypothetical protein TNCV_4358591 [Trichonephila clavipes]|nr:hypothetical protein TNCV_4358591 [Trichonephila clavipes]
MSNARCYQARMRPFSCCKQNLDSSEKMSSLPFVHPGQASHCLEKVAKNSVHEERCRLIMEPVQNCSLYAIVKGNR